MTKRVKAPIQLVPFGRCIGERARQVRLPSDSIVWDAKWYVANRVWSNLGWSVRLAAGLEIRR